MGKRKPEEASCAYCERHLERPFITEDPVVPRKKGGVHSWSNIVWADAICNVLKTDMYEHEFVSFLSHVVYKYIPKEEYQKLRLDNTSKKKFFRKFWSWYRKQQRKGLFLSGSGYPQLITRQLELPL